MQNVAHENLAVVLTDMGSHLKLAGNVETAIDRYALVNVSWLECFQTSPSVLVRSYKEALEHNPNYAPAYFNLVRALPA